MSQSANPQDEARSNRIPPKLRLFVQRWADEVDTFRRYSDENEVTGPGYRVICSKMRTKYVPDGFNVTEVIPFPEQRISVSIREE